MTKLVHNEHNSETDWFPFLMIKAPKSSVRFLRGGNFSSPRRYANFVPEGVSEEEWRDRSGRMPRLIDRLPRYPLYQQLKDLRVKLGNLVDVSEIDELVDCLNGRFAHFQEGVPVSEIEVFPLDRTVLNNPIIETDAPITRVDWPDEVRGCSCFVLLSPSFLPLSISFHPFLLAV